MVRRRRDGVFARGAVACTFFAFGSKSLPGRITSARRGKVTWQKRSTSFHPHPNPNTSFTFYKGNLFSNFPASFVWRVDIWLNFAAGVIVQQDPIWRVPIWACPPRTPLGSAPTLRDRPPGPRRLPADVRLRRHHIAQL